MPWNGSGVFNRSNGVNTGTQVWQDDAGAGVKIRADRHDTHDQDIADGMENTVTRDGQNSPSANLPMATYRHTGVGNAVARTDYAAAGQVQDGAFIWCGTAGGTADAITLTPTPAITAYAAGQTFRWIAGASPNTGAATVAISGLTTKALENDGAALAAGDHAAGKMYEGVYDGTAFQISRVITGTVDGSITTAKIANNAVDETKLKDALIGDFTEVTVAAGDSILLGDADDSGNTKRDTVQGILDLVQSGLPRSYLAGLQLSNNGTDGDHDIDIAAGTCRDAANAADITLAAFTKRIDATWAAGSGNGGLSSSLTAPANDTWYHVFAIIVSGSADVGFDTSITAANLVSDHSATSWRRLGSVLTNGSANITAFVQDGDWFWWTDPPLDVNTASPGTSAVTATLSTPSGLSTIARVNVRAPGSAAMYLSPLDVNDEAPSDSAAPLAVLGQDGNIEFAGPVTVKTNTSSQIRYRLSGNGQTYIATLGWIDTRGRNA